MSTYKERSDRSDRYWNSLSSSFFSFSFTTQIDFRNDRSIDPPRRHSRLRCHSSTSIERLRSSLRAPILVDLLRFEFQIRFSVFFLSKKIFPVACGISRGSGHDQSCRCLVFYLLYLYFGKQNNVERRSFFRLDLNTMTTQIARRLVILGAPGSGKGTIASRIVKTYGMPHIVVGDLLRQHIQRKTRTFVRTFDRKKGNKFSPSPSSSGKQTNQGAYR